MKANHNRPARSRHGSILLLTALLLVFMVALLAFAIDVGYLEVAKVQLQQSADAAALAAAEELVDTNAVTGVVNMSAPITRARNAAVQYAGLNTVCNSAPVVNSNTGNGTSGDIVIGYLSDPSNRALAMDFSNQDVFNAVQVRVQRTSAENGEVGLFFAHLLGHNSQAVQTTATAAIVHNFNGFQMPSDDSNLMMLPFAYDKQTWDKLIAGTADPEISDHYSWNDATKQISAGSDQVREVNLYPGSNVLLPSGNRGTVDIGSSNNSTADIARQITQGINASDMAYMPGNKVALNAQGALTLNGDTGISAGVKDELASIEGQPRIICLYSTVVGPGNNAQYTIVGFAGVRIMAVKLTGAASSKYVIVQPAAITVKGGIEGDGLSNYYMSSPPWLVR